MTRKSTLTRRRFLARAAGVSMNGIATAEIVVEKS